MNEQIIKRKKDFEVKKDYLDKISRKLSYLRLLIFVITIIWVIIFFKFEIKNISLLFIILFILTFFIMVFKHGKVDKEIKVLSNYLKIIEEYENRTLVDFDKLKDKGDYFNIDDDIVKDFNLLGDNSLYQLLNVAKSLGGKRKFINYLVNPKLDEKLILENQDAIKEVRDSFDFNLDVLEELGNISDIEDADFEKYFDSLEVNFNLNSFWKYFGILLFLITDFILVLCLLDILPFLVFGVPFIIQIIISYIYMFCYGDLFENITNIGRKLAKLDNVFKKIMKYEFKSNKLKSIIKDVSLGEEGVRALRKIDEYNNLRENFITNVIFNAICSLNIMISFKYEEIILEYKKEIKKSIYALEELEALLSLTTIGLIKKDIVLPKIDNEVNLEFESIKHPLLKEEKCIDNSFGGEDGVNIITGSNMSGKSSFMRTIGVNLILMYAGTYVNAKSFSSSLMKIFSSIAVSDDLRNNISTFYGELLRIKKILDYSDKDKRPLIIFIDEIFKGTNYNDRIYGAKEVISRLSRIDGIIFVTTHDFELCDIRNKKITNYHFEEEYVKTDITFDYKLKDGKCTKTNAKYLMKKLGIIEESSNGKEET